MITISLIKNKTFSENNDINFSQMAYDNIIKNLHFYRLSCICGHKGNLIKHGYYKRSIKVLTGKEKIKVLRVKCKSCGKTHTILPDWLVPYSQISLEDHLEIIDTHLKGMSFKNIMETKPSIDESNIQYIIQKFKKHWKGRLAAFKILLSDHISESCFRIFGRQFMQIKCTPNILFS